MQSSRTRTLDTVYQFKARAGSAKYLKIKKYLNEK